MAYHSRYKGQYTPEMNSEYGFRVMQVLAEAQEAMTISEIQLKDFSLTNVTPQKMARVLGELVDMGLVVKSKSKAKNKMTYKSVAVLAEQGYDVENLVVEV